MRIGVMPVGARRFGLDDFVSSARDLESRGFATLWVPQIFGHDAVTVAALLGRETRRIEIGTAVVPTPPRHPAALAQQALTAAVACGGRFTLGIGHSHPVVIEGMFGLSYAHRARHMREYLAVLAPLLRGERAEFAGDEYRVRIALDVPGAPAVPILLAALGDRMLELAGRLASGTILWMTGPRTIERHIAPKLRAAAREAGRPEPRIVAGMYVALTADLDAARSKLARQIERYRGLPSYRAMLEKEGSLEGLALLGDERALDAGLARLRDLGVSDLEACVPQDDDAQARTLAYLESRLAASEASGASSGPGHERHPSASPRLRAT